jgi:hypothetical protein
VILSDLLGIVSVPDFTVFVGRQYRQGVRTGPGRCLDAAEMAATVIGDRIAPGEAGRDRSTHFAIDVPATSDSVRLMLVSCHGEELGDLTGYPRAVVSPYRTCVAVAVAAALVLAMADLARGDYLDEEIRMLRPGVRPPAEVIDRTRLAEGSGDFAAQCEKYLRQFPELNRWPQARSTA